MALLDVQNLTVDFDLGDESLRAVDDVSFTIDAGEALGLVGESGSGKTVTALSIMRLLDPSARIMRGHIWLDGEDLVTKSESAMQSIRGRRIGMVFQEPMTSLNPGYSVGEQVAEVYRHHLHLGSAEARRRTIEMFERVKLPGAQGNVQQIPARIQRRDAPAGDDRRCAGLPAVTADRRRTHNRGRRYDPGPDPVPARGTSAGPGPGAPVYLP